MEVKVYGYLASSLTSLVRKIINGTHGKAVSIYSQNYHMVIVHVVSWKSLSVVISYIQGTSKKGLLGDLLKLVWRKQWLFMSIIF